MFGRRTKGKSDRAQEQEVDVDVDLMLERDISGVELAVDNYLQSPTEGLQRALLTTLEALDDQLAVCDAFHARVRMATKEPKVVGATSNSPIASELRMSRPAWNLVTVPSS